MFSIVWSYLERCNTDLTSILSGTIVRAIIVYCTDYMTKIPMKTYMIFEIVRMMIHGESNGVKVMNDPLHLARSLISKIVNALSARSEIGGPIVAAMLLGNPDHYTNCMFKVVFWKSYVRAVDSYWGEDTFAQERKTQEMIVVGSDEGHIVAVRKVNDYIHRPRELERMCLVDFL